jgi:serine-type D-Ala-D-Ala carboxypeptidase (penicillin-binding protein 5/6)
VGKKKVISISLILILSLGIITHFLFLKNNDQKYSVLSPVPDFLNIADNQQVSSLNLWLPAITDFFFGKDESALQISAKSALIFDTTTDRVLYDKNSKDKLPMASITKIMTAIIALENKKTDDKYIVLKDNLVGEDSMGLTQGETLNLEDLLYGLLLTSGNDAAEAIASNYKDGRSGFIKAMNQKAKSLGLSDTNFTNPSGLEGDGDQHTTAYDQLVITEYALSHFKTFNKIVSTFDHTITATNTHKQFNLENETNLLTSYPGVKGVKTGYTPEAGFCLVTYLDYKGHKIIGIILGSENRRQEMKDLLDFSLNSLGITPPNHS